MKHTVVVLFGNTSKLSWYHLVYVLKQFQTSHLWGLNSHDAIANIIDFEYEHS